MIDPGKMNMFAELESFVETDDGFGGTSGTWQDVTGFYGKLENVSNSRFGTGSKIDTLYTYTMTTYYMQEIEELKEKSRLVINGVYYTIVAVENVDFSNMWLKISLEKQV